MQSVDLDAQEGLLNGDIDLRRRADSVQPLRFPAGEAPLLGPFTRWVASAPAGVVRLRLRTDSGALRLTVSQRPEAPGLDEAARPAAYDPHPNAAGYQRMGERFHALALKGADNWLPD